MTMWRNRGRRGIERYMPLSSKGAAALRSSSGRLARIAGRIPWRTGASGLASMLSDGASRTVKGLRTWSDTSSERRIGSPSRRMAERSMKLSRAISALYASKSARISAEASQPDRQPTELQHFVVVFRSEDGALLEQRAFEDPASAEAWFLETEREHRDDSDVQ